MNANDIVPDYIEPLDAHRFWLMDNKGMLTSVRRCTNIPWMPDRHMHVSMARENSIMGPVLPAPLNRIGFYTYRSPDYLIPAVLSTCARDWNVALFFGTVKIWGQVVEHNMGYRSEYAMINEVNGILLPAIKNHPSPEAASFTVRKRATFMELIEALERNGYVFRAIDSPAYTEEVRPGLYKWTKEHPNQSWDTSNPQVRGANC